MALLLDPFYFYFLPSLRWVLELAVSLQLLAPVAGLSQRRRLCVCVEELGGCSALRGFVRVLGMPRGVSVLGVCYRITAW